MKQVNHIWAGETRYMLDSIRDNEVLDVHFSKKVGVLSSPVKRKGFAGLLSNDKKKRSTDEEE